MYYNGLSNGPLEGINNKIKVIKRISYGYRSFSNFKAKILLVFSLFIPSETNKKSRYSKEERQYILNKKKEIRLKRKNRKKAILLNIAQLSPNFLNQPNLTKNRFLFRRLRLLNWLKPLIKAPSKIIKGAFQPFIIYSFVFMILYLNPISLYDVLMLQVFQQMSLILILLIQCQFQLYLCLLIS